MNERSIISPQGNSGKLVNVGLVDSFLQLPGFISDQFGVSTSNSDADTSRYGLEDAPEGKEEDDAAEDEEKQQDYSLFDASCIDPDGLDGAFFLGGLDEGAPWL